MEIGHLRNSLIIQGIDYSISNRRERRMGLYIVMWIAFIAMLYVNWLATSLPINGQTTAEISHRLDVVFTPAGYVFSIWSLIYLLLFVWLVLIYPKIKNKQFDPEVGIYFILSCLFKFCLVK